MLRRIPLPTSLSSAVSSFHHHLPPLFPSSFTPLFLLPSPFKCIYPSQNFRFYNPSPPNKNNSKKYRYGENSYRQSSSQGTSKFPFSILFRRSVSPFVVILFSSLSLWFADYFSEEISSVKQMAKSLSPSCSSSPSPIPTDHVNVNVTTITEEPPQVLIVTSHSPSPSSSSSDSQVNIVAFPLSTPPSSSPLSSSSRLLHFLHQYGWPLLPYNLFANIHIPIPLIYRGDHVESYNFKAKTPDFVIHRVKSSQESQREKEKNNKINNPHVIDAIHGDNIINNNIDPYDDSYGDGDDDSTESSSSSSPSRHSHTRPPFSSDPLLLPSHRPSPSLYRHSGYDRGHMLPAADSSSNDDSFVLSNISPQNSELNRKFWANVERFCRRLANDEKNEEVIVVTGTLFKPNTWEEYTMKSENNKNGTNGKTNLPLPPPPPPSHLMNVIQHEVIPSFSPSISVPTHFYKIVLLRRTNGSLLHFSLVVPNIPIPSNMKIDHFVVPLEDIEKWSGVKFFPKLFSGIQNDKKYKMQQFDLKRWDQWWAKQK